MKKNLIIILLILLLVSCKSQNVLDHPSLFYSSIKEVRTLEESKEFSKTISSYQVKELSKEIDYPIYKPNIDDLTIYQNISNDNELLELFYIHDYQGDSSQRNFSLYYNMKYNQENEQKTFEIDWDKTIDEYLESYIPGEMGFGIKDTDSIVTLYFITLNDDGSYLGRELGYVNGILQQVIESTYFKEKTEEDPNSQLKYYYRNDIIQ